MPVKEKKSIPWWADASTQRHLPFSQIRENIIIMKDSSARMVLKCSTINFLLKSTEEQDSIIIGFQRFLNALDFPIQVIVRSTKLDINWYLDKLGNIAVKQKNPLLQNQTYEYIEYLHKLVEVAQIMKKDFYIVIPFDQDEGKSVRDTTIVGIFKNFWKSINGMNDISKVRQQIRDFANLKKGLVNRANVIQTSLENIGVRGTPLEKVEMVRFLTDYYNPSLDNITPLKWQISDYTIMD